MVTVAIPGDIVAVDSGETELIVVDVVHQDDVELLVTRAPDDLELETPMVTPANEVQVIGHVESVPGWVEDTPGQWRQA